MFSKIRTSGIVLISALIAASTFAVPTASAEARTKTVRMVFGYETAAPADAIYKQLTSKAYRVCNRPAMRSPAAREATRDCAAQLMDAAVEKIGRADVVALHDRAPRQLAALD